jgi:hypothetical protein
MPYPTVAKPVKAVLTAQEVHRLTLWKWQYRLQSEGFTKREAEHLIFLAWRDAKGMVAV